VEGAGGGPGGRDQQQANSDRGTSRPTDPSKGEQLKKIALIVALAALLIAPAGALAKTIGLSGGFVGDDIAVVKMKTVKKGGEVTAIKRFRAKKVFTDCGREEARYTVSATSKILVDEDEFDVTLGVPNSKTKIFIEGDVRKGGKKVVGTLKTNKFKETINGKKVNCKVPEQKFKVKK
jgi:hypothetical protein